MNLSRSEKKGRGTSWDSAVMGGIFWRRDRPEEDSLIGSNHRRNRYSPKSAGT